MAGLLELGRQQGRLEKMAKLMGFESSHDFDKHLDDVEAEAIEKSRSKSSREGRAKGLKGAELLNFSISESRKAGEEAVTKALRGMSMKNGDVPSEGSEHASNDNIAILVEKEEM